MLYSSKSDPFGFNIAQAFKPGKKCSLLPCTAGLDIWSTFPWSDGSPFSASQVNDALHVLLARASQMDSFFNHSFQIGAATAAAGATGFLANLSKPSEVGPEMPIANKFLLQFLPPPLR